MSWTSGYVSEIGYTYGYYRELSPALLRLACLSAGVAPPPSPCKYLELGYGQGVSINIHAAAVEGEFWGTDFIPAQAAHARSLAEASRSGAVLLDDSFVDFAARSDLPEFDVIALHGTWSWVSDENRRAIVEIVRRRLRVGGLLYISYNCTPGWTAAMPLRHLMALHAELAGSEAAGIVPKIDNAIAFAESVVNSGAFFFRVNTAAAERLKVISGQDRHYLAHEFFNRDWAVMPFSEVVKWLDAAKLSYAAPARVIEQVDAINLTPEWQKLLAEIANPILRQSVRDYLLNHQFRRDIFIKGPRTLTPLDRAEALRAQAFVLLNHPDAIAMKVNGSLGEVSLSEALYRPLIEVLAQDSFAPKTLAQIGEAPQLRGLEFEQLVMALLVLIGAEHVHPAQEPTKALRERCAALNQHIFMRARSGPDISFLASPVAGGAVSLDRFQQLFLLAMKQQRKSAADQARFVWDILSVQGQRLVRDGQPLASPEQNIAQLTEHAKAFASTRLPLLKALGVA